MHNKLILFYDTETTGKPKKYSAPVSDVDNWPRLVQLGWIVAYDSGTVAGSGRCIIRPNGWTIPEEVTKIHGISQEQAMEQGVDLYQTLVWFASIVQRCDLIVGHNIEFDLNVLGAEFIRNLNHNPLQGKATVCTMKSSADYCKLPKTTSHGTDKYKWPRLSELYEKLFGVPMGDAHEALADITNTRKCYLELKSRGIIS